MEIEKAIEFYKAKSYEEGGIRYRYTKLAISALEKQLNGGWIPVSERLPEEGMKVLVVSNNDIPIYCVAIMMNGELRVTWNHDRFEHIKIVAWQPLPEPYKEAENEVHI
jgi:hypothetical protein